MTAHAIFSLTTSTPVRVTPNGTHSGLNVSIQNINEDGYIYVGGEEVTSSDYGFRILPNAAISFELEGNDELCIISSLNSMNAAVITTTLVDM
jgi:hypothetical protein